MADTSIGLSGLDQGRRTAPLVWVLDEPDSGISDPAIGIAERLGVPFRRIALSWNRLAHLAVLARSGSLIGLASPRGTMQAAAAPFGPVQSTPGLERRRLFASATAPALTLSSGRRAAAVGLWIRQRFGGPVVHCLHAGPHRAGFDLVLVPRHEAQERAANMFPITGVPNRLSPLVLRQTRLAWRERLAHLPRPRIALLVGGPSGPLGAHDVKPAAAHALARKVAAMARSSGGSVLATTGRNTGAEATDALAAGLSSAMHVLARWGEPGETPYRGFLSWADTVVVAGGSATLLSEACAIEGSVFVALPELAGLRLRALHASFFEAGQARPLREDFSPWPRRPLDEAGRVAADLLRRFPID